MASTHLPPSQQFAAQNTAPKKDDFTGSGANGELVQQIEEMRTAGYQAVDQVIEYLSELPDGPALGRPQLGDHDLGLQEDPQPVSAAISEVVNSVLLDTVHVQHPRFFAFVPSPSNFVGALADFLASGFGIVLISM